MQMVLFANTPVFSGQYAEDLYLPFTKSDFSLPDSLQ